MFRPALLAAITVLASALPALAPAAQPLQTSLASRSPVMIELAGKEATLRIDIDSRRTARELEGDIRFTLVADGGLPATDALTCTPSLTMGCGVVVRFTGTRTRGASTTTSTVPTVLEARLEDGVFRVRDSGGFERFIEGLVANDGLAVKLRVDQAREFEFDVRGLPWPLAAFDDDHPFTARFAEDPVLGALRSRFPARYLRVITVARRELPDTGPLPAEGERKVLEAMHAEVARLRPMVPDALLERIVSNALAAAKAVGDKDPALCNALAVAARSAVTAPELKDAAVAREEYELWQQTVEQANPRNLRRIPGEDLLPSTPRFEENVRVANEQGCGMFEAVIEAMLKLPRDERRLWLRATVGTMDDPRAPAQPRR